MEFKKYNHREEEKERMAMEVITAILLIAKKKK